MALNLDYRVLLVDSSGNPLSVGGGTQYVDGATQANPTGNVVLWLDTSNVLRAASAAKPLPVNIISGSGSGVSVVDAAAWTTASSVFVPGGGVFNDSAAALTSGQQGTQRLTPNRALHASLRTQAGVEIIPASSVVDAAAWTTAVSSFLPGGGVFNDSATALTSGQQGTFRSTPNRGLHVNLRSQNGTELLPVPAALADATANPTLTQLANFPMVFNGTTWDRALDLTGATNGTKGVPAAGMVVFDTVDVQNKRVNSIASAVAGGVTGKNAPALGALKYTTAHGANPTAFAAGVFAAPLTNRHSIPFTIGGHPNVKTFAQNYTAAQTDAAVITVAAGTKIVVTGFLITCHNANSVNVSCRLGFGTASTPAYGAAQLLGTHPGIAAGSGFGRGGGSGIIGIGADDEDLRFTCSVPTGGSIDVDVSYYTIES